MMDVDGLTVRRGIVLASALVYWGGVWVQAHRVRRHIGRMPNVAPRGSRERWLWLGWSLVVIGWFALPFVTRSEASLVVTRLSRLLHPAGFALGVTLVGAGLAGTWWCYAVMGDSWRMGIDHVGRGRLVTGGPFGIVRHPIYLFQVILLAGAAALLPSWLPVPILGVHLACVLCKARDEEAHLARLHGDDFRAYRERTPMLLPLRWPGSRLRRRRASGR